MVIVWAFGGFERRTDLKTTPPGTLITTGPYEFRITEATAQRKKGYGGNFYWELVMIGEGRTTGKESITPSYMGNSGMFVSKDDASQEVSPPDSVRMGHNRGFDRHRFMPGLPLSAYAVVFKYKDTYRPGPTIRFAVWGLEPGKRYLASEEESWHDGTWGYQSTFQCGCCPTILLDFDVNIPRCVRCRRCTWRACQAQREEPGFSSDCGTGSVRKARYPSRSRLISRPGVAG